MDYQSIKKQAAEIGIPLEEALHARRDFIEGQICYYRKIIEIDQEFAASCSSEIEQRLNSEDIERAIEEIKFWKWELRKLDPEWDKSGKHINRETVAQAKAYPIANLLPDPVRHNRTNCPFHMGGKSTGTMSIKNNFAYCFHCNKGWDTIEVMMALHGLDFKQAVMELAGRG